MKKPRTYLLNLLMRLLLVLLQFGQFVLRLAEVVTTLDDFGQQVVALLGQVLFDLKELVHAEGKQKGNVMHIS